MTDSVSFPWTDERSKFDFQLKQGKAREHEHARMQLYGKFEVKSETYYWERTGNVAIEYECNGKPSGIAVTDAQWWTHHLGTTDGETVTWLTVPVERMKRLARQAIRDKRFRIGGGGKRTKFALVRIKDIVRP